MHLEASWRGLLPPELTGSNSRREAAQIAPINGGEDLVWAPQYAKGQQEIETLRNVVDQVKELNAVWRELRRRCCTVQETGSPMSSIRSAMGLHGIPRSRAERYECCPSGRRQVKASPASSQDPCGRAVR